MTAPELLALVAGATVATSAAVALVLLLRRALRRAFGATVGYATWLIVPTTLAAMLLPGPRADALMPAWRMLPAGLQVQSLPPTSGIGAGPAAWLLAAWLLGMALLALRFALQQHRFHRGLGVLQERGDGTFQAQAVAGLPAVVGFLRPRTVLPADFDSRYDTGQQHLLRAHEQVHVARGDMRVNALAAAIRCLFWFNPLVHVAAHAFRLDQEMACDERVVGMYPSMRRAYGEAMLRTQLQVQPLPLGCHWGFQHPLRERIQMLRQPTPSKLRWLAGSSLVLAVAIASGVAAWAGQPGVHGASGHVAGEHTPAPAYPAAAVAEGIGGRVVLLIDVDETGRPTGLLVETSEPAGVFDQAAIDAARGWLFQPAMEAGKPVPSRVRVPVDFAPDEPSVEIPTVNQHPAG